MPANAPVAKTHSASSGLDSVSVVRDSLHCAVIVLDEHGKITGFNPCAEQMTGLAASKMIGQGLESIPKLQPIVTSAFSGECDQGQFAIRDAKNEEVVVSASATPLRTKDGKIFGCVLVLNNISAMRKWEGNMQRLDRLHSVGTLSASMAHEIKNAFVAVRTFVDLLLEKRQDQELAGLTRQELGRIDALVGQMLKFSGPPKPAMAPVSLHLVLGKSLLLVQHLLDEKKIKLSRSFGATADRMQGDADQLQQALLNLIFNALDAMEAGGQLEVSTELLPAHSKIEGLPANDGEAYVKIVIRDSGVGIPAENMGRLYEPFFTTKPDGTGLGLAITRRIIHEHQGIISVQSELNKGTSFSLIFPARS